jgi:hypothetical protein
MKQQVSSHAVNRRLQIMRVTIITAPIPRVAATASERHRRLSAGWMLCWVVCIHFAASRGLFEITRARNSSRPIILTNSSHFHSIFIAWKRKRIRDLFGLYIRGNTQAYAYIRVQLRTWVISSGFWAFLDNEITRAWWTWYLQETAISLTDEII